MNKRDLAGEAAATTMFRWNGTVESDWRSMAHGVAPLGQFLCGSRRRRAVTSRSGLG